MFNTRAFVFINTTAFKYFRLGQHCIFGQISVRIAAPHYVSPENPALPFMIYDFEPARCP